MNLEAFEDIGNIRLKNKCSQLETIVPHWGHVAMSGDLIVTTWGEGLLVASEYRTGVLLILHRTKPLQQRTMQPQMSIVLRLRKSDLHNHLRKRYHLFRHIKTSFI